jgi:glycerol-3-phosphate dehydrogenase (NAD(P)+)
LSEKQEISKPYAHVGVIGAGAWGTALGLAATLAGQKTTLWARESDVVDSINRAHENTRFLPAVPLPATLIATGNLTQAARADALLLAVPAQHLRATLGAIATLRNVEAPLVLCAKGIERVSAKLLSEVLVECLPDAKPAILSGPSFARDVARNLPTAVTVAARMDIARRLQATLGHSTFRPYASDDIVGVALGGAAKNVYAIACGIVAGMGLGESARAALLARGFAELMRLGEALGAKSETLMGLSGLGDLVLTATSPTSRNFSFGFELGKGRARAELETGGHGLAEGVETAPALIARAKRHGIEMPIAETTAAILDGTIGRDQAIMRLMTRPLRTE